MRTMTAAACFALTAIGAASNPAVAGCDDKVVANIAIPPGQVCWAYNGRATIFAGSFGGGQRVSVQMGGGRTPTASGPGGFSMESSGPGLSFVTPRGGAYRFSFYPCVLWRSPGSVRICAR